MPNSIKTKFLALILSLGMAATTYASHILGGEMSYECLGYDPVTQMGEYRIKLVVLRDCVNGQAGPDIPAPVAVFDATTSAFITDFGMPLLDTSFVNYISLCIQVCTYEYDVLLPFNPNGYIFTYQRCCLTYTLTNLQNRQGIVFPLTMTAQAQLLCNTSPVFYREPIYVTPNNASMDYDQSVVDLEGDSLHYYICPVEEALAAHYPTATLGDPLSYDAPPFPSVVYVSPFSSAQPIGPNSITSIDSSRGVLTLMPLSLGIYQMAYCVDEFRNGVKLSSSKRNFQVNSLVTFVYPVVGFSYGNRIIRFDDKLIGASYSQRHFLTNVGVDTIIITNMQQIGSNRFTVSPLPNDTIQPGDTLWINVAFTPINTAIESGTITITHSGMAGITTIQMIGNGILQGVNVDTEETRFTFDISPNPVTDNLILSCPSFVKDFNNLSASILDIQGRVLKRYEISATQTSLDLSNLPKGTYTIFVENPEGKISNKIFVKM